MQFFIINYKNRHHWMTQALRTQIIRKNVMHIIALATKDKTKFDDYNKVKKNLKSSQRNTEILYYSNQFDLYKNYLATSWKLFKTIIGKNLKSSLNTTFTINNIIFKAGDPTHIANYKSISVLTLFSKVFEKIMYNLF